MDEFLEKYVKPYETVWYFKQREVGHIAWRIGTGGNVEILHIRADEPGKGTGRYLVRKMLEQLIFNAPYHSVFVFCRKVNHVAVDAYTRWGFTMTDVPDLYKDGGTVLGTITYENLRREMGV